MSFILRNNINKPALILNRCCTITGAKPVITRRLFASPSTTTNQPPPTTTDQPPPTIEIKITPIPRHGENIQTKRARLLYQSRKRGILETDLLLSNFAKLYLKDMTSQELDEYDKLLDEQDWDIYYWATYNYDMKPCPEYWEKSNIMAKLRLIAENRDRVLYRMPDL